MASNNAYYRIALAGPRMPDLVERETSARSFVVCPRRIHHFAALPVARHLRAG